MVKKEFKTKKKRKTIGGVNKRVLPQRDSSFKRFLNVRHPFDRLLSAFYNVKRNNYSQRKSYRGPQRKQVEYLLKKYKATNSDFRLEQFTNFLASPDRGHPADVYYDRHWDAYTRSCRTCSETYTFVTRTETSKNDSGPILKILEYPEDYFSQMEKRNQIARPNDTQIVPSVSQVPPPFGAYLTEFQDIDPKVIRRLYEKYRGDFEGFGYHFKVDSSMAYCSIKTESGDYCC